MLGALERDQMRAKAMGVQVGDSAGERQHRPVMNVQLTALATFIEHIATKYREYMYPFHRQWYVNISAALGSQSAHAETIARVHKSNPKRAPHRIRHLSNIIAPNCRALIGYLSRADPDMEILPGEVADPFQVDMAQGAKRWVDQHRRMDNWGTKHLDILDWTVYTGLGISKAVYDDHAGPRRAAVDEEGRPLIDPANGQPLVDRRGRPVLYTTGTASTKIVSPFSWMYNINARTSEELQLCGEHGWRSFAELERRTPGVIDRYGLVPENQQQDQAGYYQKQLAQTVGPSGTFTGLTPDSEFNGTNVYEVYIAPYTLDAAFFHNLEDPRTGEKFDGWEIHEKGCFAIICQQQVLEVRPIDQMDLEGVMPDRDWHPYTMWPCYTFPGRLLPQGIPDNLIPLQEGINFILARLRESHKMMGQPKWFLPKGCGITKGQLTNEAGEKVPFNPVAGEPKAWSPVPMPAYIFNLLGMLEQHADRVGSSPPMTRGEAQGQIRSGYGVQLLQEQALSQYTPMVRRLTRAHENHQRQLILREIQYQTEPVNVRFSVRDGDWEQQKFLASNMSPDFHIRIMPGTEMPQSKAAIMAEYDRGVAWGALQPAINKDHQQIIARGMGWSIPLHFDGNEEENIRQARYENWVIVEGGSPVTHPVYNHPVHINEHIRFVLSQRFRELQERDPQLAARIYHHIGKHQGFMQMAAQGMSFPQPVSPQEDLQRLLGPEQTQASMGQPGSAVQAGGGGGAGPSNQGPVTTGVGTQLGTARAGGAGQSIQPQEAMGAVGSV